MMPVTRPVLKYFALTFTATWLLWAASRAILSAEPFTPGLAWLGRWTFLLGVFAPSLVAIALTARGEGRSAVLALLRRVVKWDVGARWYIFAIAYIPAVKLTAAALHRAITGAWPRFGDEPWYLMAAALLISTWVQAGEEIGWRGYALPRMAARIGLGPASILLGLLWAAWHLPIFFFTEADLFGQSFLLYALQVTALSVALAWLYWRTHGSLLLVMLLHAAVNNFKDIVPSAEPGVTNALALSHSLVAWLTVALLWLTAAFFLVQMRGKKVLGAGF